MSETVREDMDTLIEVVKQMLPDDPKFDFECGNAWYEGCDLVDGERTYFVVPTEDMECPNCGTPLSDSLRKARQILERMEG